MTFDRTKFIIAYHPQNVAATTVVLNNVRILQADPTASDVFDERRLEVYRRPREILRFQKL